MWRLGYHMSRISQRDKITSRLHRRATKTVPLAILKGVRQKIVGSVPRVSPYLLPKGTKTYSWKLETTGPNNLAFNEFEADDDGRIYNIKIKWPAGSEYLYYVQMQVDSAVVFPADLSQNLRGDLGVDEYQVDIPFQRGTKVRFTMVTDATLAVNTRMACWVDLSARYKSRVKGV